MVIFNYARAPTYAGRSMTASSKRNGIQYSGYGHCCETKMTLQKAQIVFKCTPAWVGSPKEPPAFPAIIALPWTSLHSAHAQRKTRPTTFGIPVPRVIRSAGARALFKTTESHHLIAGAQTDSLVTALLSFITRCYSSPSCFVSYVFAYPHDDLHARARLKGRPLLGSLRR